MVANEDALELAHGQQAVELGCVGVLLRAGEGAMNGTLPSSDRADPYVLRRECQRRPSALRRSPQGRDGPRNRPSAMYSAVL